MDEDLFNELVESVEEGGAILRGETEASRTYLAEEPDVVAIREKYDLSQARFASVLGISARSRIGSKAAGLLRVQLGSFSVWQPSIPRPYSTSLSRPPDTWVRTSLAAPL